MKKYEVAILMGSDSDYGVVQKAEEVLNEFSINYETRVLSAHRTPTQTVEFVRFSERCGTKVFIAAAGGAAHLAGVVAAHTHLPVIGIPIMGKSLNGLDSLLSIVQMPAGIPVAAVAIDGARNAALLAVQILSISNISMQTAFRRFKKKMEKEVLEKNNKLMKAKNSSPKK